MNTIISNARNSGIYKPADHFVVELMEDLGYDQDTKMLDREAMLIRWIWHCNQHLRIASTYTRLKITIVVNNCLITKPLDYIKLIDISVPTDGGRCVSPYFVSDRTGAVTGRGMDTYSGGSNSVFSVYESRDAFETSSNMEGRAVDLTYTGYHLSGNGLPMVDTRYRETYKKWCMLKRAEQTGSKADIQFYMQMFQDAYKRDKASVMTDGISELHLDQLAAKIRNPYTFDQKNYYSRIQDIINMRYSLGLQNQPIIGRMFTDNSDPII